MKMDYAKATYTVCGYDGFALTEALRLWRTKFEDFKDFQREVTNHPALKDFENMVKEMWDSIDKYTVQDAFAQSNTEIRRVYFDCLGVNRLMAELQPKLMDSQVIKKKRTRWDAKNDPYVYEFEDLYELYQLDGDKLFPADQWRRSANPVFAVRCKCTTTQREYWLYVPTEAATGERWWREDAKYTYDAIRAIAWTIRLDVDNPEKIYRQGDIIVTKLSEKSKTVPAYHLNKDQYLQLMYSET